MYIYIYIHEHTYMLLKLLNNAYSQLSKIVNYIRDHVLDLIPSKFSNFSQIKINETPVLYEKQG